ncbi:MAG: proton-conducting transporter membrane subunit, partial [Myxococcaceae bacterium]
AGSVLLLIIAGNLAFFAFAWAAVSVALHQLLIFFPERYGARVTARKKFLFSRLGDVALLAALWIIWHAVGTFDYVELFTLGSKTSSHALGVANTLLVIAALIKSAQFPFHGWLPDTMETPTPVSALMHAGIINAGGFLIIRLSPLIVLTPGALELLAAVGGVTALFGSLVMITQTSVKRSLAFSTIAQMGFMMLQCGLGAFALALFHIVAHSLYKAHAFLRSGSVIDQACLSGKSLEKKYLGIRGIIAVFIIALALVFSLAFISGVIVWGDTTQCYFIFILGIAVAQLLWNWWSISKRFVDFFQILIGLSFLSLLFFFLHSGIELLVGNCLPLAPDITMGWPVLTFILFAFCLLALRVFLPPSSFSTRFGRSLFVHVYNGFYVNTVVNRLIASIWPVRHSQE